MEIDADTLPPNAELDCDVCIVGSGAAGITVAHRLLPHGTKVIVLESSLVNQRGVLADAQREVVRLYGSTATEPAINELRRAGEASQARAASQVGAASNADGHRYEDPVVQPLYRGEVSEEMARIDPGFLTRSRIRVYGGTTNCWGGWTRTLSPIDFDRSDLDRSWKWPIDAATLHGPYRTALHYCSLGEFDPYDYDRAEAWIGQTEEPIAVFPPATGKVRTGVFSVMNGDGPALDGALDFQHVWGPSLIASPNVTLVRNANVRRVIPDASRRTIARIGAQTIDRKTSPVRPGHHFTVRAKHYVMAAGGIETARLLMISGELGNQYGHLGRNFMVHPLNEYAGQLQMRGTPSREYLNFYSGYPRLKRAAWPPAIFATYVPTDATLRDDRIGNFRAMVNFYSGGINLNWEQLPNPKSQIRLSNKLDLFGDPEVDLGWATLPIDTHTAERALSHTIAEVVKLGFATGGTSDPRITRAGDHHMGTTRMSAESRDGYVNADCRAHEVGNLYIASSSVFATGGVSNPTLTIIALAARLGDHLARL